MGCVAADAGNRHARPRRIGFAGCGVMVAEPVAGEYVFARGLVIVAHAANVIYGFIEERCEVRGMGTMAGRALPGCYRRMNMFSAEWPLVVAAIARTGQFPFQQFGALACVRVVAARTAHAERGVDDFLLEHRFIMAAEAELGLIRGKSPRNLVFYLMRDVPCIYRRVACVAAHGHRGMHGFALIQFSVALKAVNGGGGGKAGR